MHRLDLLGGDDRAQVRPAQVADVGVVEQPQAYGALTGDLLRRRPRRRSGAGAAAPTSCRSGRGARAARRHRRTRRTGACPRPRPRASRGRRAAPRRPRTGPAGWTRRPPYRRRRGAPALPARAGCVPRASVSSLPSCGAPRRRGLLRGLAGRRALLPAAVVFLAGGALLRRRALAGRCSCGPARSSSRRCRSGRARRRASSASSSPAVPSPAASSPPVGSPRAALARSTLRCSAASRSTTSPAAVLGRPGHLVHLAALELGADHGLDRLLVVVLVLVGVVVARQRLDQHVGHLQLGRLGGVLGVAEVGELRRRGPRPATASSASR